MGPSGSGKSTLLDLLAGRKNSGSRDGQILFNGTNPTKDHYRSMIGYVEQFDTLVGELTVENMYVE
jgi:ABC-type multidrug transport system ATPase subunit